MFRSYTCCDTRPGEYPSALSVAGTLTEYRSTIYALVIPLVVDVPPLDLTLGQQVPEDAVLGSSPGQHGEEPALALMDIGHVLGAGQLAVGHVQ